MGINLDLISPEFREGYISRHTKRVREKHRKYLDRIRVLQERACKQVGFLSNPKRHEHPYPNMWSWNDVYDCWKEINSQRRSISRLIEKEGMYLI